MKKYGLNRSDLEDRDDGTRLLSWEACRTVPAQQQLLRCEKCEKLDVRIYSMGLGDGDCG